MFQAVHRVAPHFREHDHLAEFGGHFTKLVDADSFRNHGGDGGHGLHALVDADVVAPAHEVRAAGQPLNHRGGIVQHKDAVPGHQHVVEEEHAVLLVVLDAKWVAKVAGIKGDRLPAEDLQALAAGGDGKCLDEPRVGAPNEGCGERDVGVVAHLGCSGELLAARDDDALVGLLHHVQGEVFLLDLPSFVLGLQASVHLGVAQRVGEKDVVLLAVPVVVDHVFAKVTVGILDGAQGLAVVVEAKHELGQQVRAAPKLAPCLLVPNFAVAPLLAQVFGAARQDVG